tara:strand:- start:228 stop:878 length:651 start_codon:yes stop_codon:yes gene_type:complete
MPVKKSKKESTTDVSEKPKRTLNPIIKAMNDYRNNVIAEHVGSKAPKKTSPVFKLTLAAARTEMGLDDKDKNTIEVVNKAQEIFEANTSKYLKMAEVAESQPVEKKPTKSKGKKTEEVEVKETKAKGKKSQPKKKVVEADSDDEEIELSKPSKANKSKGKKSQPKKKVVESDSESEDDIEDEEIELSKPSKAKKSQAKKVVESDSDSDDSLSSDSD